MEDQRLREIKVAFIGVVVVSWVSPAVAYIDPGSGSAIMSAIIGFFVAIGLAVKTYWYKLKSLFQRKEQDGSPEPGETSTKPSDD